MKSIYKDRNFLLIAGGKLISLLGTAVYEIGLMWYILSEYRQNSGGMLAWIMILGTLPAVILGGFIGSLADKWNKKYIMILADLVSGTMVLAVTVCMHFGKINAALLLTATAILSVTASLVSISVNSIIPEIFCIDCLYTVNSINQLVERVTLLGGFAFGGALVAVLGTETVFFLNSTSFFVSAACMAFIKYSWKGIINETKCLGFIEDFREVWAFIREHGNMLRLTLLFTVVNFLWDPLINIAVPYILKNSFSVSSTQFGIIQAALPSGFCIGALYFSKRPKILKNRHMIFYTVLVVNSLFTLISIPVIFDKFFQGMGIITLYLSSVLACGGIFSAALNISVSVVIQTLIPSDIRGKYWGFTRSLIGGMVPVGAAIVGMLIGKVQTSILFVVTVLAVYMVIITVPRGSYAVNPIGSIIGMAGDAE